ncbi:uncharacterized protein LOC110849693 isoform X2 [Folsomia candida]|nr:uncharacterized protein LOC110849693 isoform X2 [Folsomia candida]XP_035707741.1 uncharacterized protein LOC110849693 isoform X2 [Folsomia candida]
MEGQIASLHPASNLDELRAVISLVQKKLAQLYTTLDNVAKNATDELQPEIDGLIASVSTVCVSLFSLKLTIADIESRLKEVQIVDIVAKIISGPVPRYENDVFKKGNAPTVISTIVTLSYCEILKDVNHIFNLLDFLSLLENDIKLWGYQELYHAVLANGQLYNTAQPFIVANKIVGLAKNSNFIIAKAAMSFLSEIVHPIITPVVMQETALQFSYQVNVTEINHENGTVATLQDVTFIRKTSIRILNYGHIDDHLSIRFGCVIFVNDYTNMKVAYTLRHGNVLITRIVNEAGVDWDNQGDVLMWIEATCSFCSDCLKSMPTNGNTDMWQIFANKIACASYRVRVFGND